MAETLTLSERLINFADTAKLMREWSNFITVTQDEENDIRAATVEIARLKALVRRCGPMGEQNDRDL